MKLSTRHIAACAMIGVAAALLTIAVMLPVYAAPRMKKIPLDISAATVSEANGSVLDIDALSKTGKVKTTTNVPLRAYVYVTAENPADAGSVTIQAATMVERTDRTDDAKLVSASVDRVTLNRVTAAPLTDPVPTIRLDNNRPPVSVPREGFQYKLPFNTQKQSYPFFDTVARVTLPLDYADDERQINGMRLYHFRHKLAPLNLAVKQPDQLLTMPASAWGLPGGDAPVRMDLHYEVERDLWVEPVSGSIVAQEQHVRRRLARSVNDPAAVTTLDMRTRFDDSTVQRTAGIANDARTKIIWGTRYIPVSAAAAGVVLLAAGIWLGTRRVRRDKESGLGQSSSEPSYSSAP